MTDTGHSLRVLLATAPHLVATSRRTIPATRAVGATPAELLRSPAGLPVILSAAIVGLVDESMDQRHEGSDS
jgi:hypothetical protein